MSNYPGETERKYARAYFEFLSTDCEILCVVRTQSSLRNSNTKLVYSSSGRVELGLSINNSNKLEEKFYFNHLLLFTICNRFTIQIAAIVRPNRLLRGTGVERSCLLLLHNIPLIGASLLISFLHPKHASEKVKALGTSEESNRGKIETTSNTDIENLTCRKKKDTDATAIRAVLAVAIAFAAIAAFSSAAARVASAALANMYNIQVIAQSSTMGDFVKNNNQQLAPHVVSMIVSQLQEARPSIPKDASSTLHVSERNGQSGGTSRTINQVLSPVPRLLHPT
ncbi:uncharacterized protein [Spinacia oleracea]|uniref:Uncharacterized protein n=1 Tax=Spinacia oleracea TaxID=3562 RepID=A0ABM3RQE2_SPIOL|nr:uncharacterized protein LOC110796200 [Spinacia oleracea]